MKITRSVLRRLIKEVLEEKKKRKKHNYLYPYVFGYHYDHDHDLGDYGNIGFDSDGGGE